MIVRIACTAAAAALVLVSASVQSTWSTERRTPSAGQPQQGVATPRGAAIGNSRGVAPMLQQGTDTPGRPAQQTFPNSISTQPIGRDTGAQRSTFQQGTATTGSVARPTAPNRAATQPIGRSGSPQRPARRE